MKLAEDHTPSVLFIVAAPMFTRPGGVDPYIAKVAQANIQAILPKFILNPISQPARSVSRRRPLGLC